MTAARKANPVPASTTVSAFAITVRGTTSPKPSVKNVVALMYTSDQNPVAPPPTPVIAEPAAHCSGQTEHTLPGAHRPSRKSNDPAPCTERNESRRGRGG